MDSQEWIKSQRKELPITLTADECRGKTYIVTGATSGLGLECTKHLVRLECAHVVIAVRNLKRGEVVKASIENKTGRLGVIHVWHLDLASFDSVTAFAKRAEAELERVDGVVANAGVANGYWIETAGMESNLTVNVLGNLLFVVLMFPILRKSAVNFTMTPCITITGTMGAFSTLQCLQKFDRDNIFNDLNTRKRWEPDIDARYVFSKLLLHFATRQIAAIAPVKRTGVVVNIVNPGLCKTNLQSNVRLPMRIIALIMKLLIGRTAEVGSRTLLHGIASGAESHGKYLSDCQIREEEVPEWISNEDGMICQGKVWAQITEKLESIQQGCIKAVLHDV
ncbi:Uncharacterized protein TPAR_07214 [Tolypocladium paradoxum]|uniref:Uncharacterized protein n=1 Tax=Tolypocladium paradoxum TaxID=94208 RepID=A0A2S4KQY5_9HYPO|nr:Uncharacterized protein TPAR_07214 [Tolypocladium paradoxum]